MTQHSVEPYAFLQNKIKISQLTDNIVFHLIKSVKLSRKSINNETNKLRISKVTNSIMKHFEGGSCRVTLVVAFGFLPQNVWKVAGTYEWYLVIL